MTKEEMLQVKEWIRNQKVDDDPILEVICAEIAVQLTRIADRLDKGLLVVSDFEDYKQMNKEK